MTGDEKRLREFLTLAGDSLKTFRFYEKRSTSFVDTLEGVAWIESSAGKTVGYGHIDYDGKKRWLGICVAEKYRGRGIGRLIMGELVRESGQKDLHLAVDLDNDRAFRLYKKFGFVETHRDEKYIFMFRERTWPTQSEASSTN